MSFNMVMWYGNVSVNKAKQKLFRVVNTASASTCGNVYMCMLK